MLTLLSEIHFWSTQEDVIIKHTDYGSFKYYSKKDVNGLLCSQSKKKYCELRGIVWHPPNKRPQKLRDRIKELEDYLLHNKIVCYCWADNRLQLLLSTGVLVNITIDINTGDVSSIQFEKQLAAKLQVNILCDGVILGQQIICICNDGHVLGYGGQWKDGWIVEGGPRRRLNFHNDWLAVWGKSESEHPQPWSPLGKDYQRANLHLYWVGPKGAELLAYRKTDGDPIEIVVSKTCSRTLIVIEQKVSLRGSVSVEVSHYELIGSNLKRITVTSVPLQTQVSCCALSKKEDKLLIGCIDGSLALLDRNRGSTKTVKALFIPKFVEWHPLGAIVAILNERGQLQYFDTALNSIKSQLTAEDPTPTALLDLSGYFNTQFTISSVSWGAKDLILSLEQGPIALISHIDRGLSFKSLVQRYIQSGKIDKAIRLLLSWEFNEQSFAALQKICAYLLSRPMSEECAKYLQDALGCYHSPAVPVSSEMRARFGNQVYSLTRRFFHQLVRASMFETAFLLAVDLGHHDLFMDLHYIAVKIGETEMAAAARAQASALLSRCSSEASNCSRSSCSQCSESGSSDSEEFNGNSNSYNRDHNKPNTASGVASSQLESVLVINNNNNNNENFLTTNFNQACPKTYKSTSNTNNNVPTLVDVPKINLAPRATYVKAPQVPSNFTKMQTNPTVIAPPLPFAPPLPNVSSASSVSLSLGIPYPNPTSASSVSNLYSHPQRFSSYSSSTAASANRVQTKPALSLTNLSFSINPQIAAKHTFTSVKPQVIPPPPLPVQTAAPSHPVVNHASSSSNNLMYNTGAVKKVQPKVKFSDTVTAFIVPEIKRPIRPAPPPHLTDPQKELADSLPLCHPNEDYLKDFAPVRKGDANENSEQPKIKVVHFGVV